MNPNLLRIRVHPNKYNFKDWDTKALKKYFNNPIDIKDIGKTYISSSFMKYKRVWPISKNGKLTTNQLIDDIH